MKLNLFKKFLLALFLIALLPLTFSSATLFLNLRNTSTRLAEKISDASDRQASEALQSRARQIAEDVSQFLKECESDLRLVAALPKESATVRTFYESRNLDLWRRTGSAEAPSEEKVSAPRYASLELINKNGRQLFVIQNGKPVPTGQLKDVSIPATTQFKSENYFAKTALLKKGEIYVSHVTGFHIGKKEQLGTAKDSEQAYGGKEYQGVIRFATPLYSPDGTFNGAVVLSLDHRHLMEFSQHVLPGSVEKTVFPSYKSGNYAFIFDDEGWIITHPNFWDIRGVLADGTPVQPYTERSSKEAIESGRIPFNLDKAGFIHPNYPVVARAVREGKSGYVDTTNVGGARKVMAYAPIIYTSGDYARSGIFGGVTIGFQTDQFHEPARAAVTIINEQMRGHLQKSGLILVMAMVLALLAAWRISRGITRPLALLTEQAKALAAGSGSSRVAISSGDEVGELAAAFNRMAAELETRNLHLLETMEQLDRSRQEVTGERNFMEGVVNSISSAIIPFDSSGKMISVNTKGMTILAGKPVAGQHYRKVFENWPELVERVDATIAGKRPFGRTPFSVDGKFFDIGIFPIGSAMEQGITVTIRDETEKERMREEMTRMDRFASLGRLSAGIAHEIRNPLTGITLLLDDLHDRTNFDPDSRTMLEKALAEIERVEKLINALLSYASPPRSEFSQGDFGMVIKDTLLFFRKACEKAGVTLSSRIGEVPLFAFDQDKIRQMLLNLLRNSLIATRPGGVITVAAWAENGAAKLTIIDTGQGIPAGDIEQIFEPFFTRSKAGTGLGLSITQRIVEEHHGTISAASIAGEGTVFTVLLPLEAASEESDGEIIIDDEEFIRENVDRVLRDEGYQVVQAVDGATALELLGGEEIDLALLDLNLGAENGIDVLKAMKEIDPELLVIVVTGYGSVETAVESLKLGAFHYMKKPFKADALRLIVKLALQTSSLKREVRAIRKGELEFFDKIPMVGVSSALKEIMRQAREVARHAGATVLITGESGTGKELIAKSIHHLSDRREAPFIEINCASIPVNLLESELFGHEKGAFTDATIRKQGLFEMANRGTIFLDEVGEMEPAMQAKLLRVLESRTLRRVGGIKSIEVDVRVVAATNRNLRDAIQQGDFREDLFYRLNVFPIHIPALRERREDIPVLVTFFLEIYSRKFSRSFSAVDPAAMKRMLAYNWPGNIRELKNSMERICIMQPGPKLLPEHLPPEIRGDDRHSSPAFNAGAAYEIGLEEAVADFEREIILSALQQSNKNVLQAAQLLKVPRGTLRYKMEKMGITAVE